MVLLAWGGWVAPRKGFHCLFEAMEGEKNPCSLSSHATGRCSAETVYWSSW